MKKYLLLLAAISFAMAAHAQETLSTDKLSVPQSAAFKLIDVSPTLSGSSSTPKSFALGVLQSFGDNNGWPQNYTAEVAPYWWIKSDKKNFDNYIGLKGFSLNTATTPKMNPFAALKLTSISIAFANKGMNPDSVNSKQKIFSIGAHTTVIRVYRSGYATDLGTKVSSWHQRAAAFIDAMYDTTAVGKLYQIAADNQDTAQMRILLKLIDSKNQAQLDTIAASIQKQLEEKPLFQLDASAAYATYGVGDSTWKTGRSAAWTSAILNVPLNSKQVGSKQVNYFSVSAYMRYMYDLYSKNDKTVTPGNAIDFGGKVMLEFDPISFGTEYVHRSYYGSTALESQRFVGFINYRISKSIYFSGTFGNDFGFNKSRLFSALGINWGFGNEKVSF